MTRIETFEETITEIKSFWDMVWIKTMEVKICKKKLINLWEELRFKQKDKTRVTGEGRKKVRENLDKLLESGASEAKQLIQKQKLVTVLR